MWFKLKPVQNRIHDDLQTPCTWWPPHNKSAMHWKCPKICLPAYTSELSMTRTHKIKTTPLLCFLFCPMAQSCILTQATTKRINTSEVRLYRKILRISWVDPMSSNDVVLRKMNKNIEVINFVKVKKIEFGTRYANQRIYGLVQDMLQVKLLNKREPGRKISWLKNLRTWFKTTSTGLYWVALC